MRQINWQDVANILTLCVPYLIALGVILLIGIIVMIACGKMDKPARYLVRRESLLAMLLALVTVVNLICFGPMNSLLTLSTGEGQITEESLQESEAIVEEIADEGIVLLKNEGQCLPLTGTNLNVFGWSSTNPSYGGAGSGALSDAYPMASNFVADTQSATSLLAMRKACKNMMYTIVNSRAYSDEAINPGLHKWQIAAIVIDLLLAVGLIALQAMVIRGYKKRKAGV